MRNACLALLLGATSGLPALAQTQFTPGVVKAEVYTGIPGVTIPNLTSNAKFPNSPDRIEYVKFIEYPPGDDSGFAPPGNVENNYGVRLSGFIIPTENANYVFYMSADDAGEFWLSTDDNPANKRMVANEPTWNGVRAWATPDRRPGCGGNGGTEPCENVTGPIALEAGKRYYFEALMKEGGGGDNLSVTWTKQGEPAPDPFFNLPIGGANIGTMAPTGVRILGQPKNTLVADGGTATFSVAVDSVTPPTYQWLKNGSPISGATERTLSLPVVIADNGAKISVRITAGSTTITSSEATLAVLGNREYTGIAKMELYTGIGGTSVQGNLVTNPKYPGSPDTVTFRTSIDSGSGLGANYGGRISGWIVPAETASYVFYMASDDNGEFYLSTDSNPANAQLIATEPQWAAYREYTGFAGGRRFDRGDGNPINISWPVTLTAGQKYYYEALWKEGGGGDHMSVAWAKEGQPAPTAPISGNVLRALAPALTIADHPADTTVVDYRPATFTVTVVGPATGYQWQTAPAGSTTFTDIAGATAATYTVPSARLSEAGRQYRVVVTGSENQVQTSSAATLRVTPIDATTPPFIVRRPTAPPLFYKGDTVTISVEAAGENLTYQWYRSKVPVPNSNTATLTFANADHTVVGDYYVEVSNANGTVNTFPDNDVRVLMAGAFVIEAEDFNFDGGSHLPEVSQMPFVAGQYRNRIGIPDIDFMHGYDTGDGGAYQYGRFTAVDANVIPIKGHEAGDVRRGSFNVSPNYAIGWTDAGEWQNYTRIFPKGTYAIYGGVSYDSRAANDINMTVSRVANPRTPDGSSAFGSGPAEEGKQQGVTKIGTFLSPGTGGWSNNDVVPLKNDDGTIATVQLDGEQTLRVTMNKPDGDLDYLLLYCIDCPTPPKASYFVIEAEDFNFDGGKTKAEASVMPLASNLYAGLSAVAGIDYNDPGNERDAGAQAYRIGETPNVAITGTGDNNRIVFNYTPNFRIGWMGNGDWWNYTRTIPEGNYQVYAALSRGDSGTSSGSLSLVENPTSADQTLTELGTFFYSGGSGGWGINQYLPLVDSEGKPAKVRLGGTQTLRYTGIGGGDFDYLVLVSTDATQPQGDPRITGITKSGNQITITWVNGGTLEIATTLPAGTTGWTSTGNSSGTHTFTPSGTQSYFRVRR